ncbi:MAG: hypothetical protein WA542_06050 [Candidatus Acidiferrum sp.]
MAIDGAWARRGEAAKKSIDTATADTEARILQSPFMKTSSVLDAAKGGSLSKRFAVNALHTNMQVWGTGHGLGGALRKLKRRAVVPNEG